MGADASETPAGAPSNDEVAARLDEYGRLLERNAAPSYRSRAYRRAAVVVAALKRPVASMADVTRLPGIGDSIARSIHDILHGSWEALDALRQQPPDPELALAPGAQALADALQGDLHAHTLATDGRNTIEEMADAARRRGYTYLAITDHSKETRIAGGLSEEQMRMHMARIRRAAEAYEDLHLLTGAEVDILRDGRLDFPDALLADLDVVVCSVHFRHKLSGKEQTERILKAMSNDHADILAHPTGRRRGIRPGLALDIERLAEAAADQGWAIELNGAPERRDLDADGAQAAARHNVAFTIDSDAHSIGELANVHNACREADAAGIQAHRILNALPFDAFRRRLRS